MNKYFEKLRKKVRQEMDRFGFEEHIISAQNIISINIIEWAHEGEDHQSRITINRKTNSISFSQMRRIKTNGNYVWEVVPFGVMAPLFEVIALARDAYQISTEFRILNDVWTESHIIPGTNGDGK